MIHSTLSVCKSNGHSQQSLRDWVMSSNQRSCYSALGKNKQTKTVLPDGTLALTCCPIA